MPMTDLPGDDLDHPHAHRGQGAGYVPGEPGNLAGLSARGELWQLEERHHGSRMHRHHLNRDAEIRKDGLHLARESSRVSSE